MGCLTRAWPWMLVALLVAPACGGDSPTSPGTTSNVVVDGVLRPCRFQTYGAMTATLDGTPWVPVMTRALHSGPDLAD
jgi:hypothetical protein